MTGAWHTCNIVCCVHVFVSDVRLDADPTPWLFARMCTPCEGVLPGVLPPAAYTTSQLLVPICYHVFASRQLLNVALRTWDRVAGL
jgi:hypothetical protein